MSTRNERRDSSTDHVGIRRITKEYYEWLCAHELDNLDETDQFLERHHLPTPAQEEIDDVNRPTSI